MAVKSKVSNKTQNESDADYHPVSIVPEVYSDSLKASGSLIQNRSAFLSEKSFQSFEGMEIQQKLFTKKLQKGQRINRKPQAFANRII